MQPLQEIQDQMFLYEPIDEIDLKINKALHRAKRSIMPRKNGKLLADVGNNAAGQQAIEADILSEKIFMKTLIMEDLSGILYSEESGVRRFGNPEIGDENSLVLLLDPLDGSQNYLKGLPFGCISVAYGKYDPHAKLGDLDHATIMNLYADEIYFAKKGKGAFFNGKPIEHVKERKYKSFDDRNIQISYYAYGKNASKYYFEFQDIYSLRSLGSAAWELAMVAENRNDAFADIRGLLKTHDFAAAKIIIEEVGGKINFLSLDKEEVSKIPLDDFISGYSVLASTDQDLLEFLLKEFKRHGLL